MAPSSPNAGPRERRFARFAWGVLGYNVLVIAWGAYVRATFSGDGCGSHWPLCNGEVVPHAQQTKTLVELSHRVTSGISMILVYVMAILAFRAFAKGSPVRRAAAASAAFISSEALVGAGLVLFELVAHDKSMKRALSMSIHLTNTFFLLGSLALTAYFATGGVPARFRGRGWRGAVALLAMGSTLALGITGALAALGDTLFPARSLAEGLAQDLSLTSHVLLRLRAAHPFVAVTAAVFLLAFATYAPRDGSEGASVKRLARVLAVSVFLQLGLGALNVLLLAPVWIQMLHLVLADAVWVTLVMLVWAVLADRAPEPVRDAATAPA
jgi:heme A synthase